MPRKTKPHYHVKIRRNGAVYGTFGPYAKKADALVDAGVLGGPGLDVAVSSCSSCGAAKAPAKRRNAGRRVTIEKDRLEGGYVVYLHTPGSASRPGRETGLTPSIPKAQASEIASAVRSYPKSMSVKQIGSEVNRRLFGAAKAPAKSRRNTPKIRVPREFSKTPWGYSVYNVQITHDPRTQWSVQVEDRVVQTGLSLGAAVKAAQAFAKEERAKRSTAPAKRRNTSKAQDGLKRRLATFDRKVAAIRSDDDVLAAARYLDKVESWAYENGVGLTAATASRLRKLAFSAGETADRGRRAGRGREIQSLRDEKRAAEKPYDWMRRNASTSHRGVRIQRKAGTARFTDPSTGKRRTVSQGAGGLAEAKRRIDASLGGGVRVAANPRRNSAAVATALRVAGPFLIDVVVSMGKARISALAKLSPDARVAAIRRAFRFNLPVRAALSSDAAASAVADALVRLARSGKADAALSAAGSAAKRQTVRRNTSDLPPRLSTRGRRKLR